MMMTNLSIPITIVREPSYGKFRGICRLVVRRGSWFETSFLLVRWKWTTSLNLNICKHWLVEEQ